MNIRRLLILLAATVALALAMVGVAFAAPSRQDASDTGADAEIAAHGRAYLGLVTRPLTDRIKELMGLPADFQGVLVTGVEPRSPAAHAGMHLRDVVYEANGHDITEPGHLVRLVNSMSPEDVLTLKYVRQGERASADIVLGKWSDYHSPEIPGWLRKLYNLLGQFPNTVDATINVIGEDGAVHQYVVVPGSIATVTDDAIALTKRTGDSVRFHIDDDTIIVKGGQRVRLANLEAGDRAVVLQKDGLVKAVVVAPFKHDEDDDSRRGRGSERQREVRETLREQAESVREYFKALIERQKQERHDVLEQMREVQRSSPSLEQAIQRLEALREKHPELAERIDEQIATLHERMAHLQQRLEERESHHSGRES